MFRCLNLCETFIAFVKYQQQQHKAVVYVKYIVKIQTLTRTHGPYLIGIIVSGRLDVNKYNKKLFGC